jgi:hypothetical protein
MNGSVLEYAVPEQLFSTLENPVQGISTVKALKIANDQAIPIYTIDQTNIDSIAPLLQIDSGSLTDIRNAVNAGKTIITPKSEITFKSWTGTGYIIIDKNTGAGAYLVSGGISGGYVVDILDPDEYEYSYIERVVNNFLNTNEVIWGTMAPTGLAFILRASNPVAKLIGTITALEWLSLGFGGAVMEGAAFSWLETAVLVAYTSLLTMLLVSAVYEIGVGIGSLIIATQLCIRRP